MCSHLYSVVLDTDVFFKEFLDVFWFQHFVFVLPRVEQHLKPPVVPRHLILNLGVSGHSSYHSDRHEPDRGSTLKLGVHYNPKLVLGIENIRIG